MPTDCNHSALSSLPQQINCENIHFPKSKDSVCEHLVGLFRLKVSLGYFVLIEMEKKDTVVRQAAASPKITNIYRSKNF